MHHTQKHTVRQHATQNLKPKHSLASIFRLEKKGRERGGGEDGGLHDPTPNCARHTQTLYSTHADTNSTHPQNPPEHIYTTRGGRGSAAHNPHRCILPASYGVCFGKVGGWEGDGRGEANTNVLKSMAVKLFVYLCCYCVAGCVNWAYTVFLYLKTNGDSLVLPPW
jgi:hypothetical protein